MKTEQLVLDHFNESFAIRGLDLFLCKAVDVTDGLWLAQLFSHHSRDCLGDVLPVLQTEGVRVAE